ncbi:MAG: hypothetical protein Q8916_10605 [Bacteroidota bacterium]|nr:hypothetical protein [Bacteroidota bacterium]MDP4230839.1 hypothetical protein [Bacteroidota bacterium]MDP4237543.1 hypothetical protein [Bacteroidota bacterium]
MRTGSFRRARFAGIITLVMVPFMLHAQPSEQAPQRTFTAPPPQTPGKESAPKTETHSESDELSSDGIAPHIDIVKVTAGNPEHLTPGFYASYKPKAYDTVYIYEGETEQFEIVKLRALKEVIQGDSTSVAEEVSFRMGHFDESGQSVSSEKHVKTNSIIVRSGFIPAQGFGSKRYRFAVKPGDFKLTKNSMISASVQLLHHAELGTILCSISHIDYDKGIFYVETSNEVPKGENINWIIVNTD